MTSGNRRPAAASKSRLSIRTVALGFLIAGFIWVSRGGNVIDRIWSDLLSTSVMQPVSATYVVLSLTASDIQHYQRDPELNQDVSPLRVLLARKISQFKAAGVRRVFLDMYLAGTEDTPGNNALAAAFSEFGRDRIAFGRTSNPAFSAQKPLYDAATQTELGILADHDGNYRSIRIPSSGVNGNPVIWLATGKSDHSAVALDLRLDPKSVPVYSLTQITNPDVLKGLAGKSVIIDLDQSAARSAASLPLHGFVDRGRLMALGAESYQSGAPARLKFVEQMGLVLALASLFAGLAIGGRIQSVHAGMAMILVVNLAVIMACLGLTLRWGGTSYPSTTAFMGTVGLMVALAVRLRLTELVIGLFAGDLSPEEAWLWRSQADQDRPVLIFGADGAIRRANVAAINALHLGPEKYSDQAMELVRQCMPAIGVRSDHLTTGERQKSRWRLEWPHEHISLAVFYDVTDQVSKEEDLQRKLVTDPLTGLRNRLGFDAALERIDMAGGEAFALYYLDMNGFKQVNDTLGHDAGDELLAIAARRFESVVREGDVLARLGGDEFGLCLYGEISDVGAQRMADKLANTLTAPIRLKSGEVKVGVAVGFSIRKAEDTTTAEVIGRADQEMYRQKKVLKLQASGRPAGSVAA